MARQTKQEKAAEARRERLQQEIARFKEAHQRLQLAQTYDRQAVWAAAKEAETAGRSAEVSLLQLLNQAEYEREYAERRYRDALGHAQRRIEDALRYLDAGYRSGSSVSMNEADVEAARATFDTTVQAEVRLAYAANWRVPALEGKEEAARLNERAALRVRRDSYGEPGAEVVLWLVERLLESGDVVLVSAAEVEEAVSRLRSDDENPAKLARFDAANATYTEESAAWQAVAALSGQYLY